MTHHKEKNVINLISYNCVTQQFKMVNRFKTKWTSSQNTQIKIISTSVITLRDTASCINEAVKTMHITFLMRCDYATSTLQTSKK